MRDERGQTATEYLGALLIVAVIIAALALTDLGGRIEWHMRVLVCKIAGGTNCTDQAGNPDAPALAKCVVKASDRSFEASVKVLVFKLEGGIAGTKRVSADGTTYVTLKANAGAGLEFSSPGAEAGEESSPKGEFAITGKGELARTWKFTSEDDADSFIGHMVDKVKAKADLIPNFLQGADDYDPPDEDSNTVYGGVSVTASASAGAGGAYANIGGGIEAGVGARYMANGDKTYFFRAKANLGASAGTLAGGFGADGDGEIVIGITYDRNGKEKALTVNGVGTVGGGLDLRGGADSLTGLLKKASGSFAGQQAKRLEFESTLDLTDPENLRAARAFIDQGDAGELMQRFDDHAKTNARLYDVDKDSLGVDVDGTVVGFSAKYSQSDARLTDAWFDPGEGGFQPWYECASI